MQAKYRLRKNSHFEYVYRRGTSVACRNIILVHCKSRESLPKFGFSVSKKIGKSVVRSRCKRLMRENVRLLVSEFPPRRNYVFIARAGIKDSNFYEIRRDILYLLRKANLPAGKPSAPADNQSSAENGINREGPS